MDTTLRKTLTLAMLLAGASLSQAAVTYVDPPDIMIPLTYSGIYLDIKTGGTEEPSSPTGMADGDAYTVSYGEPAGNWDVNFFFGGAGVAHSPTLQPYRGSTTNQLSAVHNLGLDTLINGGPADPEPPAGPSNPLAIPDFGGSGTGTGGGSGIVNSGNHMGAGANQFVNGTEGFIAFVLDPGTPGEQYGWVRVTLNNDGTEGIIHDWAYAPDMILVGMVPEPSALLLLTFGGLALLRRRR